MADPTTPRSNVPVTIGLLDGRVQSWVLSRFVPTLTTLAVEQPAGPARPGTAARGLIAVEDVAYIGFHTLTGPPPTPTPDAAPLRIHVAGGKSFLVKTSQPGAPGIGDFYATPVGGDGPFREIFFYHRGINAREQGQPLGELLIAQGVAAPAAVQQGLASQNVRIGDLLIEQERVSQAMVDSASATQSGKRMRLGEVLIEAGLATPADIAHALAEQARRKGQKLGEILVAQKTITEEQLIATLAHKFGLATIDLTKVQVNPAAATEVPRELIARYGCMPIDSDDKFLTVAISDPLQSEVHDALRHHLKRKLLREVLVAPSQLEPFVKAFLASHSSSEPVVDHGNVKVLLQQLEVERPEIGAGPGGGGPATVSEHDSTIVRLANQIILDAARRGASDIHIEPNGAEQPMVIRFRIDGECTTYQEVRSAFRSPLVARLKIMAELDITERRKPQDGKIRLRVGDNILELRVATLPTVNGNEDVVMRILAGSKPLPLERMGLSPRNLRELRTTIAKPYGLVLCVGPTGSGKTTTLHSILGALNTGDTKIWTAEDPVEITQKGLRQLQVQPKIGLTFAAAMRSFLRADPDVIMVGEMRDEETASTAIEASLTGHLVLSTLHTNSAPETITRLLDMGLDPFSFADALLGVLAQRLARRMCPHCRQRVAATQRDFDELEQGFGAETLAAQGVTMGPDLTIWRAPGCDHCGHSGYKGRVALHELLISSDELKELIYKKSPMARIREVALSGGMTTLKQDGLVKTLTGDTDMKQVLAVASR